MYRLLLLCLIIVYFGSGCNRAKFEAGDNSPFTSPISMQNLKVNLEFLASDELEGRDTGSKGLDLAALYLKSEMKKGNIGYLDELGGYYQEFDLQFTQFVDTTQIRLIDKDGRPIVSFQYYYDFIGSSRYYPPLDTTVNLVFAGYGIEAEEYNYNDYDSLEVDGKIVLVMPGEPESEDSSFFDGRKDTRYSSLYSKAATAKRKGALGIILASKSEGKYGWDKMVEWVGKGSFKLIDDQDTSQIKRHRLPSAVIKTSTLDSFLVRENYSLAMIDELTDQGKPVPKFEFTAKVDVNWQFKTDSLVRTKNVVGFIAGQDPKLKEEYVAICCHYDHVGEASNGIYYGADDNASGTVAVLEVAKAVAFNKGIKRSVLFIFHTAEEKGLLGSRYFVANSKTREKIVALINLDMVGRGPADSIYNIGADALSKEFSELVEEANNESVNLVFDYRFNDINHPERLYYRSDHYSYAKYDIPSVFFFDYMTEDYHKITDTADKINYAKLARITELSYQILVKTANRPDRPALNKIANK